MSKMTHAGSATAAAGVGERLRGHQETFNRLTDRHMHRDTHMHVASFWSEATLG